MRKDESFLNINTITKVIHHNLFTLTILLDMCIKSKKPQEPRKRKLKDNMKSEHRYQGIVKTTMLLKGHNT